MPGLLMLFGPLIDAHARTSSFVPKIPFVGRFAYATQQIVPPIFLVGHHRGHALRQQLPVRLRLTAV